MVLILSQGVTLIYTLHNAGCFVAKPIWENESNRPLNIFRAKAAEKAIGFRLMKNELSQLPGFDPYQHCRVDEMHIISGLYQHVMMAAIKVLLDFLVDQIGMDTHQTNLVFEQMSTRLLQCTTATCGLAFRDWVRTYLIRTYNAVRENQSPDALKAYEIEELMLVSGTCLL